MSTHYNLIFMHSYAKYLIRYSSKIFLSSCNLFELVRKYPATYKIIQTKIGYSNIKSFNVFLLFFAFIRIVLTRKPLILLKNTVLLFDSLQYLSSI